LVVSRQVSTNLENARLFNESKQAYKELKATQEHVIQTEKLRALGVMTSGIAHDFNNVLTTILGRAQLTIDKTKNEKVKHNLEIIEQASLDGASIVRRLQDFARVRTDQSLNVINVNELIESSLEMIKPCLDEACETNNSNIEVIFTKNIVSPIKGNAADLREALVNILVNAIEAMTYGGQLTIATNQRNGWVVISISDTGIGMSEKVRKRVFDPFFTTKGLNGLGMGLSTTYSVIKRHMGQIRVSSEPGRGSTFIIKIPVIRGYEDELTQKSYSTSTKKATILVIDDDGGSRDVLKDILGQAGHTVDTALNGKMGLYLSSQKHYDVVIVDIGMPDISGRVIASTIKTNSPQTQIVLVTGWGIQLTKEELRELGVSSIIAKPFQKNDVLNMLYINDLTQTKNNQTSIAD